MELILLQYIIIIRVTEGSDYDAFKYRVKVCTNELKRRISLTLSVSDHWVFRNKFG